MDDLDEKLTQYLKNFFRMPIDDRFKQDILKTSGFDGDDAFDLIEGLHDTFGVNFEEYRWEFHHHDEGSLLRPSWPFKSPYVVENRIPITYDMLKSAVETGVWSVEYPDKEIDIIRMDRWNAPIVFVLGLGAFGIAMSLFKLFGN